MSELENQPRQILLDVDSIKRDLDLVLQFLERGYSLSTELVDGGFVLTFYPPGSKPAPRPPAAQPREIKRHGAALKPVRSAERAPVGAVGKSGT